MTRRSALVAGLISVTVIAAVLVLTAHDARRSEAAPRSTYTLVQMNLCLSGRAACYPRVSYPTGVRYAEEMIRDHHADAVTLAEVCRTDVDDIAAATGLHARFSAVSAGDVAVSCIDPDGRGAYGVAVLTRDPILHTVDVPYEAQDGYEQRRRICAATHAATVCATHLDIRGAEQVDAANDAQCAELAEVLERLARRGPVIVGGDMNRGDGCAAAGMWTTTDADADQASGKQHVYGTASFVGAEAQVESMPYTDHDALVVSSRLRP